MPLADNFAASLERIFGGSDAHGVVDVAALIAHLEASATGLQGLTIQPVDPAEGEAFVSPSNAAVSFNWILRSVHNAGPFLGWEPTKQPVVLLVHTVGRRQASGWEYVSRWDTLGALGQLGVLAVGRPVVPWTLASPTPNGEDLPSGTESTVPAMHGYAVAPAYSPDGQPR